MILLNCADGRSVHVQGEARFADFPARFAAETGKPPAVLRQVRQLKISGCSIDTFAFLEALPALRMAYFLACKSDVWGTMPALPRLVSLGLHNLKQGKRYLADVSLLRAFPRLVYLYVNLLGASSLPELPRLRRLRVVLGSFRNENDVRAAYDFSPFRQIPRLRVFAGYAAVDRHRIPAEAFVPVLENPALKSFSYVQMYRVEERKLAELIVRYNPSLRETTLSPDEIGRMRRTRFAD